MFSPMWRSVAGSGCSPDACARATEQAEDEIAFVGDLGVGSGLTDKHAPDITKKAREIYYCHNFICLLTKHRMPYGYVLHTGIKQTQ